MTTDQDTAFINLFQDACRKCFGLALTSPLTEADAKQLSNAILESTGLLIGVKSIRNYSLFVLNEGKRENPSVATLDTLARYVLQAPATDDIQRKIHEPHHPYWFRYKGNFTAGNAGVNAVKQQRGTTKPIRIVSAAMGIALLALLMISYWLSNDNGARFIESFSRIHSDTLKLHGWILRNVDTTWWAKRNVTTGHLSLYTLPGDNWPTNNQHTEIKNALTRKLPEGCFSAEVRMSGFIPTHNWQQAGIILSEDTTSTAKAIRLSLGYNDFFGGYSEPAEIIIQGMSSTESAAHSNPEEFAHIPLFRLTAGQERIVADNLAASALKIERKGDHYRFLFATGTMAGFAFKEAVSQTFHITPRYLTLFAIQGTTPALAPVIPVHFNMFSLTSISCP